MTSAHWWCGLQSLARSGHACSQQQPEASHSQFMGAGRGGVWGAPWVRSAGRWRSASDCGLRLLQMKKKKLTRWCPRHSPWHPQSRMSGCGQKIAMPFTSQGGEQSLCHQSPGSWGISKCLFDLLLRESSASRASASRRQWRPNCFARCILASMSRRSCLGTG